MVRQLGTWEFARDPNAPRQVTEAINIFPN